MDVLCTDKTGTLTEAQHPARAGTSTPRARDERAGARAGLPEQPLRDRAQEPAGRGHPRARHARRRPAGARSTRCRSTSSAGASRCWSSDGDERLLVVKGAPEDVLRAVDALRGGGRRRRGRWTRRRARRSTRRFERAGRGGLPGARHRLPATSGPTTRTPPWATRRELVVRRLRRLPRPAQGRAPAAALAALAARGVAVKILTGDNELRDAARLRASSACRSPACSPGDELARAERRRRCARAVEQANLFCRVNPAAEEPHHPGAASARGHVVGYPRRRHQRRAGAARGRRRHLGRQRGRRGQGGGRHRPARARPRRAARRRARGPAHVRATSRKYILMGTSSNFGNMFSMAGASLFLPFLPMLPMQILLNNLLYDLLGDRRSRSTTSTRRRSRRPRALGHAASSSASCWCIGPVSSLFDFLTFALLLCAVRTPTRRCSRPAGSSSRWRPRCW